VLIEFSQGKNNFEIELIALSEGETIWQLECSCKDYTLKFHLPLDSGSCLMLNFCK